LESVVRWERRFRVWHYTVSYSQLLLRSIGVEGFDTRIDVLFSNVYLMHLKPVLHRLHIDLETKEWSRDGLDLPDGVKVNWYTINDGDAYVVATHCQWHEDQGDHHAPSRFGPLRGVE
jgi:hypothetical protein